MSPLYCGDEMEILVHDLELKIESFKKIVSILKVLLDFGFT